VTLRVEPLDDSHDLSASRSGNDELDEWLRAHARVATGQCTRTYVVVDAAKIVVGYFAITPHVVAREHVPKKIGRGAPREIPAILLAKLALNADQRGQGLGSELLVLALQTMLDAARTAGGKLIVVDAIDDAAAAFYLHHDFVSLPNRSDRLVIKIRTAAKRSTSTGHKGAALGLRTCRPSRVGTTSR
jgi:GNAT superfamily N-acetyltransferase